MEKVGLQKILKATPSKALVIRINLIFLAFCLLIYACLLLRPSLSLYRDNYAASLVRCSLRDRDCLHKTDIGVVKMKTVLEETPNQPSNDSRKIEKPGLLKEIIGRGERMGMVNMEGEDVREWREHGEITHIPFEKVSKYMEWSHLFPEFIDEEEEREGTSCPEIPMPEYGKKRNKIELVVVKLPCRYPEEGWGREVFRLQVHLVAANVVANRARRDRRGRAKVLFWSKCKPMLELFRCEDMVRREQEWWYYQPQVARLEYKLSLPVGSCQLALPLWGPGIEQVYDVSKLQHNGETAKREAYATVLHSSEAYVCGAITLAQSLLQSGTKRDLILLLDNSISAPKREALASAGWTLRLISRIRNPKADKDSYNEYNYSKFRLWQLTDYHKVIFIDADIIVLRNLDLLFHFPQMSAAGNDGSIFNSGVMVLEPSNCTFHTLMARRGDIVSYNGGDQGFLNEVYVWWHRLPRRTNFLKNFWSNTTGEATVKNQLFGADPPKLYALHYLGIKPWLCYRDYDCNWDIDDQRVYASDEAHRRWWTLHDTMDQRLQSMCALTKKRRIELDWDRMKAKDRGLPDNHWNIYVTDPRRNKQNLI